MSQDELWSELIILARKLTKISSEEELVQQQETLWDALPVEHWRRRRIYPGPEHFHSSVPHPGEVTPPVSDNNNVAVTDTLVKL